jgi:anti-sigma factor RsiW
MICLKDDRQGSELLTDYCAGALDAIRTAELEAHLHACAACRDEVDAQGKVWEALDDWAPMEVSPDFDAKLYSRIVAEKRQPWWRALPGPFVPLTAAVAVLMVAVLLWIPGSNSHLQNPSSQPVVEKIDLQQVEQALDDMDMLTPVGQAARVL